MTFISSQWENFLHRHSSSSFPHDYPPDILLLIIQLSIFSYSDINLLKCVCKELHVFTSNNPKCWKYVIMKLSDSNIISWLNSKEINYQSDQSLDYKSYDEEEKGFPIVDPLHMYTPLLSHHTTHTNYISTGPSPLYLPPLSYHVRHIQTLILYCTNRREYMNTSNCKNFFQFFPSSLTSLTLSHPQFEYDKQGIEMTQNTVRLHAPTFIYDTLFPYLPTRFPNLTSLSIAGYSLLPAELNSILCLNSLRCLSICACVIHSADEPFNIFPIIEDPKSVNKNLFNKFPHLERIELLKNYIDNQLSKLNLIKYLSASTSLRELIWSYETSWGECNTEEFIHYFANHPSLSTINVSQLLIPLTIHHDQSDKYYLSSLNSIISILLPCLKNLLQLNLTPDIFFPISGSSSRVIYHVPLTDEQMQVISSLTQLTHLYLRIPANTSYQMNYQVLNNMKQLILLELRSTDILFKPYNGTVNSLSESNSDECTASLRKLLKGELSYHFPKLRILILRHSTGLTDCDLSSFVSPHKTFPQLTDLHLPYNIQSRIPIFDQNHSTIFHSIMNRSPILYSIIQRYPIDNQPSTYQPASYILYHRSNLIEKEIEKILARKVWIYTLVAKGTLLLWLIGLFIFLYRERIGFWNSFNKNQSPYY